MVVLGTSRDLDYTRRAVWSHFVSFFFFLCFLPLLQPFRSCFTVKLQKCLLDQQTWQKFYFWVCYSFKLLIISAFGILATPSVSMRYCSCFNYNICIWFWIFYPAVFECTWDLFLMYHSRTLAVKSYLPKCHHRCNNMKTLILVFVVLCNFRWLYVLFLI